jgi:hypothetical protein
MKKDHELIVIAKAYDRSTDSRRVFLLRAGGTSPLTKGGQGGVNNA